MERGYWIRSKPVYSTLIWQPCATAHLVMVDGSAGAMAAIQLFQQMQPEQQTTVMYLQDAAGTIDTGSTSDIGNNGDTTNIGNTLQKIAPDDVYVYQTSDELVAAFQLYLSTACMGLQIYVAGSEKFMWALAEAAFAYGVNDGDMHKQLTGTLARSVYCVHCKTITHDAHTNIKQCAGCARMLFVRDHFSRRLGAYMGLMVDAESPGDVPDIEEIYP